MMWNKAATSALTGSIIVMSRTGQFPGLVEVMMMTWTIICCTC
jgi:hypothetical protein